MSIQRWLIILLMGITTGRWATLVPSSMTLGTIQRAVPALWLGITYLLYRHLGRRWVALVAALGIWALVMELIGTSTWWPYGAFEYNHQLSREIAGLVPVTLWLIWPVLVLGIAAWVRHTFSLLNKQQRIIMGTLALVWLDLLLDPVHVAQGIWSYTDGGIWFDVPWTNYLWWIRTGSISMLITTIFLDIHKSLPSSLVASGRFLWGYFSIQFFFVISKFGV